MQSHRLVLPAICLVVIGLGVLAYSLGPPSAPATTQPDASAPTAAPATGDAAPNWNGLSVRNFGPVPQCGGAAAIEAVLGLLRDKVADRTLGLANVHVAGHSQVGDVEAWDCDAEVQMGRGSRRIRYQVAQLAAGRDLWQITISGS